jgi:hypothetical protein
MEVDMRNTRGLLVREERLEGPVDQLGNGQVIEVCLASDRLNPALLDVERSPVSLLTGITGLGEGDLTIFPPGRKFLERGY